MNKKTNLPVSDFDRMFSNFFNPNRMIESFMTPSNMFSNYKETDKAYIYCFDMPGVKNEDIQIDVKDNYIQIVAERKNHLENGNETYYKYQQSFTIPTNVDKDNLEAHYENGVLNLGLPKMEAKITDAKKVEVTSGENKGSIWDFLPFTSNKN